VKISLPGLGVPSDKVSAVQDVEKPGTERHVKVLEDFSNEVVFEDRKVEV